jgi:hypothetical protein
MGLPAEERVVRKVRWQTLRVAATIRGDQDYDQERSGMSGHDRESPLTYKCYGHPQEKAAPR